VPVQSVFKLGGDSVGYDAVILLDEKIVLKAREYVKGTPSTPTLTPVLNFDPVQIYLLQLRVCLIYLKSCYTFIL
jgi:hypothetical protein